VLVLALDTSTPAVTAGVVEVIDGAVTVRAARVTHDARKHGELLLPGVLAACAEAGIALPDVDAVVVGTGPGPFTGLRVGMVTAAALGDALGIPVHGVCSLDAIAAEVPDCLRNELGGPLLVVTDARRREVYWAAYDGASRISGPHVEAPAVLVDHIAELGALAAAGASAGVTGLPVLPPEAPGPAGLVACAVDALRAGTRPGPLEPLYLRRPDAVAPGPRKPVTTG
jgi:tRNA threonylcarbamoyl adenosine modification protein YeaZ